MNLVMKETVRNPIFDEVWDARAKPNIAIPIEKSPNCTKFLLLNLVNKKPMNGEHMITATEYMLKIYPNNSVGTPFFCSSIGKNGAIKAYALFETRVMTHMQMRLKSQTFFFFG